MQFLQLLIQFLAFLALGPGGYLFNTCGRHQFNQVVVYGAGEIGKEFIKRSLTSNTIDVVAVVDQSARKLGNTFMGIPVLEPREFIEIECRNVVIASIEYRNEMIDRVFEIVGNNSHLNIVAVPIWRP